MEARESTPRTGLDVCPTGMFPTKTRIDLVTDYAGSSYCWQDCNGLFTENLLPNARTTSATESQFYSSAVWKQGKLLSLETDIPGRIPTSTFVQFKRIKLNLSSYPRQMHPKNFVQPLYMDQGKAQDEAFSCDQSLAALGCPATVGEVTAEAQMVSITSLGLSSQNFDMIYTSTEVSNDEEKLSRHLKCKLCDKVFHQSNNLISHQRIHTERKPHQCTVCDKAFKWSHNLKMHGRIHTGEKPYQCAVCEKTFNRLANLTTHQRIHAKEKPYKCVVCEKSFNQSHDLKVHQRKHTGEKPYPCSVCEKAFRRSQHLKVHQRIHTGYKPYQCAVCEKAFSQSYVLKEHQRIHTGEMPYKCSVCEKAFKRSQNLKEHQQTHTGEKPYQCTVCEKSFNRSRRLKEHQQIHTGYKCTVCKKAFSTSETLKVHQQIHTGYSSASARSAKYLKGTSTQTHCTAAMSFVDHTN